MEQTSETIMFPFDKLGEFVAIVGLPHDTSTVASVVRRRLPLREYKYPTREWFDT